MEKNSLISVIIPCYNHAQFLNDALLSIYNQTHLNWECIVVNDGSIDNTEEITKKWLEKNSKFKYIKQKNSGLSSARNLGINNSNGAYIVTLDADDKYENTFFEKAIKVIHSNKSIGIVSSWAIRFDDYKKHDLYKPNGQTIDDFLFYNAAIGTSFFRKECWDNVEGYDESMLHGYEDWEFYIRVCKQGWKVHIIQEPLFFYRQHPTSMRTVAINNFDYDIKKYIFRKHKELYVSNYDKMIEYFLDTIKLEKKHSIKTRNSIDFKLGSLILMPIRFVKSWIK